MFSLWSTLFPSEVNTSHQCLTETLKSHPKRMKSSRKCLGQSLTVWGINKTWMSVVSCWFTSRHVLIQQPILMFEAIFAICCEEITRWLTGLQNKSFNPSCAATWVTLNNHPVLPDAKCWSAWSGLSLLVLETNTDAAAAAAARGPAIRRSSSGLQRL